MRSGRDAWAFYGNRIDVRFQYESHDAGGQWYRSYGNELWEFERGGSDEAQGSEHQRCADR